MPSYKTRLKKLAQRSLSKLNQQAERQLHHAEKQVERLQNKYLCIGITGLSQSGKSTFITSLVNQLLQHKQAQLSYFEPALEQRLLWVKQHPLKSDDLKPFPYDEAMANLYGEDAAWPASTLDASGCLLELRLKKQKAKLLPRLNDEFSLFIELRDYPGEWLLDLPLMQMSYSRWCAQCNAQFTKEPRRSLFGDLLAQLQNIDPLATADPQVISNLYNRYCEVLKSCKQHGKSLSLIQPGRFLMPGTPNQQPVPPFIPLLNCGSYSEGQLNTASDNSYFKQCERAYQVYIKQFVKPFYKDFFSKIDRQVILVDVLATLSGGPDYMDDMRQALTNITDSFVYGKQNRLLQLFNPKIEKVLFAATKADQIVAAEHSALQQLLESIVRQAYRNAEYNGVTPECLAIASVRASVQQKAQQHKDQQQGVDSLIGRSEIGKAIGYIHPQIPNRIPEGEAWSPFVEWQMPSLLPPNHLSAANADPLPHIRMDKLINALIGDHC